jgi:ElaB/YqjD/DUF883 family membrane-anchored ribosome-binding protein
MSERKEAGATPEGGVTDSPTVGASEAEAVPAATMAGERGGTEGVSAAGGEPPRPERNDMHDIIEHTRGVASQITADVREAATHLLEDQKERAAESVRSLAGALHRTAESLEEENPSVAELADRMAERIDAACMRFRERRFSELVADTEDFAQRRPALFIAGAVAVGFALGRMMAAAPPRDYRGAD